MLVSFIGWWLGLNALAGAYLFWAGRRRSRADALRDRRTRLVFRVLALQLTVALAGIVVSSSAADWSPAGLVAVLALLAFASDALPLENRAFRISGSFLALVLAAALLGPAPAAAIGLVGTMIDAARSRPPRLHLLMNLAAYATFPLVTGLGLQALRGVAGADEFALAVLPAALLANLLNFILVATPMGVVRRRRLRQMLRDVWLPLLPWQLATGVVLSAMVLAADRFGAGVIGVVAFSLIVFQLLLKALLEREQLEQRQDGMLELVVELQGLRDPRAVRHAAAVANHARDLAAAARLPAAEQRAAHTAGLLHDLGKEAFPDLLLAGARELTPVERGVIERHPLESGRLVRRVPGLEAVAAAVEAHHERPDGRGYPRGLVGDEIPFLARIVAVAEVWDALTGPDSRGRVGIRAAREELLRVAGAQLDAELVQLFLSEVVPAGATADGDEPAARQASEPLLPH